MEKEKSVCGRGGIKGDKDREDFRKKTSFAGLLKGKATYFGHRWKDF